MRPAQQRSSAMSSSGPLLRCHPDGTPEATSFLSQPLVAIIRRYIHPLVPRLAESLNIGRCSSVESPGAAQVLQFCTCIPSLNCMVQCIFAALLATNSIHTLLTCCLSRPIAALSCPHATGLRQSVAAVATSLQHYRAGCQFRNIKDARREQCAGQYRVRKSS